MGFNGFADKLTVASGCRHDVRLRAGDWPADEQGVSKNGGWRTFNNPSFKNQGQRVAYVNHHDGKGSDG